MYQVVHVYLNASDGLMINNHTCKQRLISSPFKIPDINYKSLQFSVSDRAGS